MYYSVHMKILITESQFLNILESQDKKNILNMVHQKLLGTKDGVKIFLVDGELIRDKLDIEFTMSGHHWRYHFIPKDEIWIDLFLGRGRCAKMDTRSSATALRCRFTAQKHIIHKPFQVVFFILSGTGRLVIAIPEPLIILLGFCEICGGKFTRRRIPFR